MGLRNKLRKLDGFITEQTEKPNAKRASQLEAQADKQDDRADRMAAKHMRGGRRSRAAQARADALRRKADKLK